MQLKPEMAQNLAVSCPRKISRKLHNVESRKFNAPPKSRRIWRKNGDNGLLPARIRGFLREYPRGSARAAVRAAFVQKPPKSMYFWGAKVARKEGQSAKFEYDTQFSFHLCAADRSIRSRNL